MNLLAQNSQTLQNPIIHLPLPPNLNEPCNRFSEIIGVVLFIILGFLFSLLLNFLLKLAFKKNINFFLLFIISIFIIELLLFVTNNTFNWWSTRGILLPYLLKCI